MIATGIHKTATYRKKKNWLSLLSASIVAVVLGIFLFHLFQIEPYCSYSRYVHDAEKGNYSRIEETDRYRYSIDYADYVRDDVGNASDYFGLIQISGWEVAKLGDNWGTNMKGILLESNSCAYRVDVEMRKKTDIPYLDQSDPDSKTLNVAFFTYIPQDSILAGNYRIGFLVQEERKAKVLWTEYRIEVL